MVVRRRASRFPVLEALSLPEFDEVSSTPPPAHESVDGLLLRDLDASELLLDGALFTECEIDGLNTRELRLTGARFAQSRLGRLDVPSLRGARVAMLDVEILNSRIGALDLHDAELRATLISGCKLGWVNLRAAKLNRVVFEDCVITDLDLGGAELQGVTFKNCRVESLRSTRPALRPSTCAASTSRAP